MLSNGLYQDSALKALFLNLFDPYKQYLHIALQELAAGEMTMKQVESWKIS